MTKPPPSNKTRELATLVVHDLRNPLTALLGNIQLLTAELESPTDGVREMLRDMQELAQRALSLAATILDVEEIEEGVLRVAAEDVDVEQFARQVSQHHRAAIQMRSLTLEWDLEPGLRGTFDPNLIGRVLENLLDNAVRYASKRGKIVVRARRVDQHLFFDVGNNGPAVPEFEKGRLFEKYYRLEERRAGALANRGLGLYFCKLAAQAHGGDILVLEEKDFPAVFRLRLPVVFTA